MDFRCGHHRRGFIMILNGGSGVGSEAKIIHVSPTSKVYYQKEKLVTTAIGDEYANPI